jgi:hypothetical protein
MQIQAAITDPEAVVAVYNTPVLVAGPLVAAIVAGLENAVVVGGRRQQQLLKQGHVRMVDSTNFPGTTTMICSWPGALLGGDRTI